MTWTYDPSQLSSSQLMQVRLLVGDVDTTDQQVQDEEINFALTQRGSVYGAAATICRSLSAKFSREADITLGPINQRQSQQSQAYARQTTAYELQAKVRSGALPYAGGISVADKIAREQDTDRVAPQFNIGMDDNYIPVSPAGNEGTPVGDDGGGGQI